MTLSYFQSILRFPLPLPVDGLYSFLCSPLRASEDNRRTSAQRLWGSPSLLFWNEPISWFWGEATDRQPGPGQRTAARPWPEISLPHTTYFLSEVPRFLNKEIGDPPRSSEDSGVEDAGPRGNFRLPAIRMMRVPGYQIFLPDREGKSTKGESVGAEPTRKATPFPFRAPPREELHQREPVPLNVPVGN